MNPFEYIKTLEHHAYFLHYFKDISIKLKQYLKDRFNISHSQNPDFYHEIYETLTIDDSRKIKQTHSSKSFAENNKRIFIIECRNITHEAQNSLLKIFEEPNEHTHFFLIMPGQHLLIPTLLSRLYIIKSENHNELDRELQEQADIFLKLSPKKRLEYVEGMSKENALHLLSCLEKSFHVKGVEKNKDILEKIIKIRDYMNDRSPSMKQLLEFIAISV